MDHGEPLRILVRGGSIAAGHGAARGYMDIVRERFAGRPLEIVNRSRCGENSFHGIRSFHEDIEPYRPHILLIHFGVDDAFFPVYRSEFKENIVHMVRRAREGFSPRICLLTSHPFENPHDMDAVEIYYRALREAAFDLECMHIPVHLLWAGFIHETGTEHRELVLDDVRLPNERGHEIFADAVMHRIERIIRHSGLSPADPALQAAVRQGPLFPRY